MHAGVILDPVYTGKAVHAMLADLQSNAEQWRGRRLLFIHTGGLLGMYDKGTQLQPQLEALSRSHRMHVS